MSTTCSLAHFCERVSPFSATLQAELGSGSLRRFIARSWKWLAAHGIHVFFRAATLRITRSVNSRYLALVSGIRDGTSDL